MQADARPPGCVAPGALLLNVSVDTALDVVDDGIEPHTVETLEVPNVGAPDVACIPDIAVEPLP